DPASEYPARPEWYFLGLFQLLKYFEGPLELVGTVVLPGLVGAFLFALPLLDRKPSTRVRDRLPWVGALAIVGLAGAALTGLAWVTDGADVAFQRARADATQLAERASLLAWRGVPPEGPLAMLQRDPSTRGPQLWQEHCASCHSLGGKGGLTAPDLGGFGSRAWIRGMLAAPDAPHYFGGTELRGQMPSQAARLGETGMRAVTEFLYAEGREASDPAVEESVRQQGEQLFRQRCMNCHLYRGDGSFIGTPAPNLTYYASRTWIRKHIENPASPATYDTLNRGMPRFDDQIAANEITLLTSWLRRQRLASPSPRPSAPPRPTPAGPAPAPR
ncbi:MAG: c-type cytochrome, partial [Deltaproteobacteria bacterium]|nr:c-type cytochrome [Deltaproteobacteria bacterium]